MSGFVRLAPDAQCQPQEFNEMLAISDGKLAVPDITEVSQGLSAR
jgi:hypothetical protein